MASNDFAIPTITLDGPSSRTTTFTGNRGREVAATLDKRHCERLNRENRL